jgi:carboxyl-terminal processing protease
MNKRILYPALGTVLGLNLLLGAQIYLSSAKAAEKDEPYQNYRLFTDVLEKVRQEYVDGDKLTYQDLIRGALKGMLGTLDPHSEFMEPVKYDEMRKDTEGEFGGVGIEISVNREKYLTVVSPMEDGPSYRAGIQAGDRIIKIDGKGADHLSMDDAVKRLRGEPGTEVTLTVVRAATGVEKDFKLVRATIKVDTVKDINGHRDFPVGENKIGYVRIKQFGEQTSDDLEKALRKLEGRGMRSLIIDLRGNPGGLLDQAKGVCEKFLPRNQLIVSTEGRSPQSRTEYRASGRNTHPDMPKVILVNGGSASASEIVAGCLQDLQPLTHAVILGEQTFGKGSVQSILPLPDGSALRLTTAKYYTPSHKVIHERGITPDILVPMTEDQERDLMIQHTPGALDELPDDDRQRILSTRDVQLDRATELLRGITLYSQLTDKPALGKMVSK